MHAGRVHLAGAQGQLLDPRDLLVTGAVDAQLQPQRAQELLIRAVVLGARRIALAARLIHRAAVARVDGDHGWAELRQVRQLERLFSGVATHPRQVERHLRAFGRLVVDERHGARREVQRVRDGLDGVGLAAPADLRKHEVLGDSQLLQPAPRLVVVVAAGHGLEHAAGVERHDHVAHRVGQLDVAVLEQNALPQRVVEVPHQALDGVAHQLFPLPHTCHSVTAHAATGLLLSTSTRSPGASSPEASSRSRLSTTSIAPRWPSSRRCRPHKGWIGAPSSVS